MLTVIVFRPVQCTHKSSGYSCGSELHSEVPALHPPAMVDEVCETVWIIDVITVHPQSVSDCFSVSPDWVSGYHFQTIVSWRNASTMICTTGACRVWVVYHTFMIQYSYNVILFIMHSFYSMLVLYCSMAFYRLEVCINSTSSFILKPKLVIYSIFLFSSFILMHIMCVTILHSTYSFETHPRV